MDRSTFVFILQALCWYKRLQAQSVNELLMNLLMNWVVKEKKILYFFSSLFRTDPQGILPSHMRQDRCGLIYNT